MHNGFTGVYDALRLLCTFGSSSHNLPTSEVVTDHTASGQLPQIVGMWISLGWPDPSRNDSIYMMLALVTWPPVQ